jgi:hypothetical protein
MQVIAASVRAVRVLIDFSERAMCEEFFIMLERIGGTALPGMATAWLTLNIKNLVCLQKQKEFIVL